MALCCACNCEIYDRSAGDCPYCGSDDLIYDDEPCFPELTVQEFLGTPPTPPVSRGTLQGFA